MMTKILLVDDHAVVRAGFKMLLATCADMAVIGEASRGEQAIQLYQDLKPDIVVMDLSMPGIGGLETIHRIVQRDSLALILVFSVHREHVYVRRALDAGAKGYITKNSAAETMMEAINTILAGERYVEQGLLKSNSSQSSQNDHQSIVSAFSAREFDVFNLLARGLTVNKISDQLCLGQKTVANYATQIRKKLQVSTSAELAHIAVNLGLMAR
jgi:two-component system invasion response regulator UvrY